MDKTIPSQDLRLETLRRQQEARKNRLLADPTCSNCGITKTIDDFPPNAVDYWCRVCRKNYAIALYHKKRAALDAQSLEQLRGTVNRRQNQRRAEKLANMTPDEAIKYRQAVNAGNLKRRNEVRDAVYKAYGGYRCACCGETERAFLSIDHVNNDGSVHRRQNNLKTGEQMYRWLIRNKFPSGFQILCMNCNWGKRSNNGVCPHVSGKV